MKIAMTCEIIMGDNTQKRPKSEIRSSAADRTDSDLLCAGKHV